MSNLPPNFHSFQHGNLQYPSTVAIGPALGMFPLTRWPLGHIMLGPVFNLWRAVVPLAAPPAFWFAREAMTGLPAPENEGPQFLWAYLAASVGIGLLRYLLRFFAQYTGVEVHQTEAGYSIVAYILPLPAFITEQLIMPGLLGWIGWKLFQTVSIDLGVWLMVCAASYFYVANWEWRNRDAQRRALVDDKTHAALFSHTLDTHERKASQRKQRQSSARPGKAAQLDIAGLGRGRRSR